METGAFEVRAAGGDEAATYGCSHDRPAKPAMQRLWLTGQILPVGARVLVQHTFRSGETLPIEAVYAFMLPRDAALRRFEVRGDGFEAHSELRKVEDAVREYEEGIEAGHLSTLARAYRDGVVNLSIGNLKPGGDVTVTLEVLTGVEMRDDGLRFRFPFTITPGYHPRARMIDNDGVGEIELPQSEFGDVILPPYKREADGLHEVGFDLAVRMPGRIVEIASPSHPVRLRETREVRRISLSTEADVPNRDLVLDIRTAETEPVVLAGEKHFAVAIPSAKFGQVSDAPRKVALVIDRSGSMQGQPMAQARGAVEACLGALSQSDKFAIVAFDDYVETFRDTLVNATSHERSAAQSFMKSVEARGGTELARGFSAAAKLVAGGGDVLVITDGQVMGTEEILAQARTLNVRLHCLGIGSASQDRFLAQLASSTGGVSRFVTPQERVDVAAVDLFASIGRPVAGGIQVSGASFGVAPSTAVFGGTPWVAFGEIEHDRLLKISWSGGEMEIPITSTEEAAESVRLLDGARQIAEMESRAVKGADQEIDNRLVALSTKFGLASRSMALVAVVEREGDVAGAPPVTRVVPLGMPVDTSYDAYFGAMPGQAPTGMPAMAAAPTGMPASYSRSRARFDAAPEEKVTPGMLQRLRTMVGGLLSEPAQNPAYGHDAVAVDSIGESGELDDETDRLMRIASTLAPDGGVPGGDAVDRALKTASSILLFLSEGHTPADGAFRAHVERMVRFLETLSGLPSDRRGVVARVVEFARAGRKPKRSEATKWNEVEEAID